jgi:hypothetical protein
MVLFFGSGISGIGFALSASKPINDLRQNIGELTWSGNAEVGDPHGQAAGESQCYNYDAESDANGQNDSGKVGGLDIHETCGQQRLSRPASQEPVPF